MQSISLDEEIELIEGIPYDIDFYQDFSAVCLNGQPISDMTVASIIEFLDNPKSAVQKFHDNSCVGYSAEEYRQNQEFCEWFAEYEKDKEKEKAKWKKDKKKRKEYWKRISEWLEEDNNYQNKGW